jgi:hypothetical protein
MCVCVCVCLCVCVCVWHTHLRCLLNYVGNGINTEGMKHLSVGLEHVKQLNSLDVGGMCLNECSGGVVCVVCVWHSHLLCLLNYA